jgi:ATP-dependent DNA helicase PIF1
MINYFNSFFKVGITSMNSRQKEVLDLALAGHNLVITGQAGTGKSFIVGELVKNLRASGRTVQLTCTTGIACLNYSHDLDAQTIHRWSGIDDGRYTSKEIVSVIKNSPKSALNLQRIKQTEVLVIDEISMLSKSMFEQVAEICSIRNPDFLFGGMQVIVAGDFYQLPPVPNRLYNDNGEMCFESAIFKKVLKHKVTLEEIVRQRDTTLCNVIKEVSVGNVDDEVESYMQNLNRPLSDNTNEPVMLFANNRLADVLNRKRITNHIGELYEFVAKDEGKKSLLEQFTAPKVLWLKIGAPVLLLRNLSQKLVNGLRGFVVKVEADGPVVYFKQINITTKVKKMTFSGEFCCTIYYMIKMLCRYLAQFMLTYSRGTHF